MTNGKTSWVESGLFDFLVFHHSLKVNQHSVKIDRISNLQAVEFGYLNCNLKKNIFFCRVYSICRQKSAIRNDPGSNCPCLVRSDIRNNSRGSIHILVELSVLSRISVLTYP